jgi:ribosomal-protein-serine acetyltransferase
MGDRRIAQHAGARPGAITLTPWRGLATEAVSAIVQTGCVALALTAIPIKTSERNVASQRVAERAEFVREAVLEDGRIDPDGHPSRTMLYVRRNPA